MDVRFTFQKKVAQKQGLAPVSVGEAISFSVLAPPIEFGRWHSPQVAPAAPPAPRVHSSNEYSMPL